MQALGKVILSEKENARVSRHKTMLLLAILFFVFDLGLRQLYFNANPFR